MNSLSPTRFLWFFCNPYLGVNTQPLIDNEVIAYKGITMNIIIPERQLAFGSVKITSNSDFRNFSEWSITDKNEAFELIQRVIQVWEKKGIVDYLIYAKEFSDSTSKFNWEIVPYPKSTWPLLKKIPILWKQSKVLRNITFGGSCLRQRIAKDFTNEMDNFSEPQIKQIVAITTKVQGSDPFCKQDVINNQLVFEGKEINVLYNYAPIGIGKGKLHFLIVPKQHRSNFSELTQEEYLESMELSQKLIKFYKNKGYSTAYLFDKTGVEAGQTIPHWHEHVVFTATKVQDYLGKLTVFKNMLIKASPLRKQELQTRVKSLKEELAGPLRAEKSYYIQDAEKLLTPE
jgi:diadenosine tetraphosphate (Ap4A) HIT family hydrolase